MIIKLRKYNEVGAFLIGKDLAGCANTYSIEMEAEGTCS